MWASLVSASSPAVGFKGLIRIAEVFLYVDFSPLTFLSQNNMEYTGLCAELDGLFACTFSHSRHPHPAENTSAPWTVPLCSCPVDPAPWARGAHRPLLSAVSFVDGTCSVGSVSGFWH